MKILVCIKQVPDMESRFKVASSGTWYDEADLAWRMNEYGASRPVVDAGNGGTTDRIGT